jgi:hypothetical protein
MAIHAGIPKKAIPSGIPWATYKAIKLKYLNMVCSDNAGKFLEWESFDFIRYFSGEEI